MNLKKVLNKLDEAVPVKKAASTKKIAVAPNGGPLYQKIVANLKKELLDNIKILSDQDDSEEDEYKNDIAIINKAKTISDCADAACELAWDYESFINVLVQSLGGKERSNSALFEPRDWDT